jgi:uncharacterized protein YgbK (DUF1537 family)
MVIGTNTDTTRQQVRKLSEHYAYYGQDSRLETFELPPLQALGLESCGDLLTRIDAALGERNTVVLSAAPMGDAYSRTITLAREHGLSEHQASRTVQETLARITADLARNRFFKLLLAGGETTCQICDALNSRELRVLAEIEASVPLMSDASGRWIVTKSGGFGSPMVLANVVHFIKQRESASASVHA